MKSEVRIALLSVDHEDVEGYQAALKTVFEQHVVAVDGFAWGNHAEDPSGRFRRHEDEQLTMHVPDSTAIAVSMFMEQVMNVITGRPRNDRESRKTFTIALYEVVPAGKASSTIGRVKLMDQVRFDSTAVGRGILAHPEATRSYEFDRLQDEEGKETYSHLNISGRGLIANEKTRSFLAQHAGTSVAKAVKSAAPVAK